MRNAMNKEKTKEWGNTEAINDPLTDLLRTGAKALIQQAVEAESQAFLGDYTKVTDLQGRLTVVLNGYLPVRKIVTGVDNVTVIISKLQSINMLMI
jgi:putative transposase